MLQSSRATRGEYWNLLICMSLYVHCTVYVHVCRPFFVWECVNPPILRHGNIDLEQAFNVLGRAQSQAGRAGYCLYGITEIKNISAFHCVSRIWEVAALAFLCLAFTFYNHTAVLGIQLNYNLSHREKNIIVVGDTTLFQKGGETRPSYHCHQMFFELFSWLDRWQGMGDGSENPIPQAENSCTADSPLPPQDPRGIFAAAAIFFWFFKAKVWPP